MKYQHHTVNMNDTPHPCFVSFFEETITANVKYGSHEVLVIQWFLGVILAKRMGRSF